TDFDITTQMYAGIGFQCAAFIFLWSVLELTLRAWHKQLVVPLSIVLALLMFSPAESQNWLTGLTSLQLGMSNFAAAITIWLLSRWPTTIYVLVLCVFLSWVTIGPPSAIVLWEIVFIAALTRGLTEDRLEWRYLTAFVIGIFLLVNTYFG